MATGFGGAGPGLSILIGVAKGVSDADKRKREMQQEAIRQRLMEQQIQESRDRSVVAEQREARYRQQSIIDANQAEAERQADLQKEQMKMEAQQAAIANVAAELRRQNPEMPEEVALQNAASVVGNHIPFSAFEPEDPNEGKTWGEQRYWLEKAEEEEMERELERIFKNPTARHEISRAQTVEEVAQVSEALGLNSGAATQFWKDSGKGSMHPQPRTFHEMDAREQNAVDDDAKLMVIKAQEFAEEYIRTNPETNLDREWLTKGWLDRKKRIIYDAQGKGEEVDDFKRATLSRLDLILYEILQEQKEDEPTRPVFHDIGG